VTAIGEQSGRAVRVIPAAAVGADLTHPSTVHPHCNLQYQGFYANISSAISSEFLNEKRNENCIPYFPGIHPVLSGRAEVTHLASWEGYLLYCLLLSRVLYVRQAELTYLASWAGYLINWLLLSRVLYARQAKLTHLAIWTGCLLDFSFCPEYCKHERLNSLTF